MDGAKLKQLVLDFLDEESESDLYADSRKMYENLDLAAGIFVRETMCLHADTDITTVADQQSYDLPPGFIDLYMKNSRDRFIVRYYDGDTYSFPILTSPEAIYKSNLTESIDTPGKFCIIDKPDKEDLIQGSADTDGAASGGQCTLHDASMSFTSANMVYPRDIIHNTSDGSTGYVLSVTDATHLVCALFGGTGNEWASGNNYIIQPAAEKQIKLEAPAESAGHTINVPYVCMPSPVFSDYGFWRFTPRSCRAICSGAASMFKIPKREYTDSRQLGGIFAAEVGRLRAEIARHDLRRKRKR